MKNYKFENEQKDWSFTIEAKDWDEAYDLAYENKQWNEAQEKTFDRKRTFTTWLYFSIERRHGKWRLL